MPTLRLDLIVRDKGSAVMKRFGTTAEREMAVAKRGALALGVAFAAVGTAAIKMWSDVIKVGAGFEKSMAIVGGVTRATTSELEQMTAVAREMGEVTEFTASQAADGMAFLARAGFSAQQSMAALSGVLDLATAGNVDLARAADITSNALTAMKLKVSDLGRVNDVFVATFTRANTSLEMMAESFRYAAPIAKGFGVSIEDLSAMIGLLGGAGVQGSMAGTQLAFAFQQAGKVAKKFGLDEGASLVEVLREIKRTGTSAQKIMALFGQRGGRAALILKDAIPQFDAFSETLKNASGEAKTLADVMRDTVTGSLATLKSAIESVKIEAFEALKGTINSTIKTLTEFVRENRTAIAVGMVETIGYAVEALRFFTNAWQGLKIIAAFAIEIIAIGLDQLVWLLRAVLKPLDLLYAGAVKLGLLDINPFDTMTNAVWDLRTASVLMTKDLVDDTEKINAKFDKVGQSISKAVAELKKIKTTAKNALPAASKQIDKATKSMVALQKTTALTSKEISNLKKEWDKITLESLPKAERGIERVNRQYYEMRDILPEIYEAGLATWEQIVAMDAELAKRQAEALAKLSEGTKKAAKELNEYQKSWQHMLNNMQDAGADFFYDWFRGADDGFKNLVDRFKDYFLRMLAELAAMAIARPITVSIVGSVAGSLGLGGVANAAGTAGGGISGAGGLGSLFSGAGATWSGIQGGLVEGLYALQLPVFGDAVAAMTEGVFGAAFSGLGAGILTALTGGSVTESIGAGLGSAIGSIFGPLGSIAGGMLGKFAGSLFGGGTQKIGVSSGAFGFSGDRLQGKTTFAKTGGNIGIWEHQGGPKGEVANIINQLLDQWSSVISKVKGALGDFGDDWAKSIRVQIGGYWKGDAIKNIPKEINQQIWNNLAPSFQQAQTAIYKNMVDPFNELINKYMDSGWWSGVQSSILNNDNLRIKAGGDPETELKKFDLWVGEWTKVQENLVQVALVLAQVNQEIAGQNGVNDFVTSWRAVNEKYTNWSRQLIQMGVDLDKFTELEQGRQQALDKLFTGAMEEINDIIAKHTMTSEAYEFKNGMERLQAWYDDQLVTLDFLKENRTGFDYASALTDLNLAMEYQVANLGSSAEVAIASWQDFFNEMSISSLSPTQSLEAFQAQYQQLLSGGITDELLNFIKRDYLPYRKTYTGGGQDYNEFYNQIMADLAAREEGLYVDRGLGFSPTSEPVRIQVDQGELTQSLTNALLTAISASNGSRDIVIQVGDEEIARVTLDGIIASSDLLGELVATIERAL